MWHHIIWSTIRHKGFIQGGEGGGGGDGCRTSFITADGFVSHKFQCYVFMSMHYSSFLGTNCRTVVNRVLTDFWACLCYHQIVTDVTQSTVLRKFMGLSSANVLVMRRFLFSNFGCVVLEMNGKANNVYICFIVVLYLREISKHKICFCIDAVFTYRCRHFVASFTSNNPDMPCDIQFSLLCSL